VKDICVSMAGYGVRKFYVLNTGVSTARALGPASEELREQEIALRFTDILASGARAEEGVSEQEGGARASNSLLRVLSIGSRGFRLELIYLQVDFVTSRVTLTSLMVWVHLFPSSEPVVLPIVGLAVFGDADLDPGWLVLPDAHLMFCMVQIVL